MSILVALIFVAAVSALTDVEYRNAFETFKLDYNKEYRTVAEETIRFNAFRYNLDFVLNHDPIARGFTVKINEFADLTSQEFNAVFNGLNITVDPSVLVQEDAVVEHAMAATVDWRTKGAVTGIKNQGQCGSCWSFSATGSMEAAHFFKTGRLVSLSEQNLVDCSTAQGNQGCNGGLMDQAFQYVIANNGIDTESSYPYTATGPNSCRFSTANIGATISTYHDVSRGSESALLSAVNTSPTSVAIDASHTSFQMYSSGVYYEPSCSPTNLDHGVLAIGYGTESGSDYWLVKNSWGTSWGMSGYINMARNRNNNCGIATAASWPTA